MKIINILLVILVFQVPRLFADDNCARRYAALERNPITCKYFLLSQKAVQNSLKLTPFQLASLESAMSASPTSNPAIMELHKSEKQAMEAAKTDEERVEIRRSGNEKAHQLIYQNLDVRLRTVLVPSQSTNLDGLYFQMKGPCAILEDTNVVKRLGLQSAQINQFNDVLDSQKVLLSLLRQRFLGLQIQPSRKRNLDDIGSEIDSIVRVIKEVEKDEDAELLVILNDHQRDIWSHLCGAPVSIDWKVDSFSDVPFQN
jgi:hypothetical protein